MPTGKWFIKSMTTDFTCILSRITLDLPHQIWEALSFHPQGVFLVRILHNKLFFLIDNLFRCYFSYFSPENYIFYLPGFYLIFKNKDYKMLVFVLLIPLFPLLEIEPVELRKIIFVGGYIIVIAYVLYHLFSRLRPKNS